VDFRRDRTRLKRQNSGLFPKLLDGHSGLELCPVGFAHTLAAHHERMFVVFDGATVSNEEQAVRPITTAPAGVSLRNIAGVE
jgi:hypothetical protein